MVVVEVMSSVVNLVDVQIFEVTSDSSDVVCELWIVNSTPGEVEVSQKSPEKSGSAVVVAHG